MSVAIEALELYRFFHTDDEEVQALRGVSASVDAGEVVAITGPSGSGKSTLLHCLAGLDEPDGGVVRIAGERLSRRTEAERAAIRARRIGVLFQSANLLEHLDVRRTSRQYNNWPVAGTAREPSTCWRNSVSEQRGQSLPSQLSGGETARAEWRSRSPTTQS